MLSPLDIENKKFAKTVRGYSTEEVDDFMSLILTDYENLYKENISLKDRINVLSNGIDHYKSMEDTMQNTLIMAQSAADEVKKNASEKAELIIKEANQNAKDIINSANADTAKLKSEYESLKSSILILKGQITGMLKAQIEAMENIASAVNASDDGDD